MDDGRPQAVVFAHAPSKPVLFFFFFCFVVALSSFSGTYACHFKTPHHQIIGLVNLVSRAHTHTHTHTHDTSDCALGCLHRTTSAPALSKEEQEEADLKQQLLVRGAVFAYKSALTCTRMVFVVCMLVPGQKEGSGRG